MAVVSKLQFLRGQRPRRPPRLLSGEGTSPSTCCWIGVGRIPPCIPLAPDFV
jgi:hypothetical protein